MDTILLYQWREGIAIMFAIGALTELALFVIIAVFCVYSYIRYNTLRGVPTGALLPVALIAGVLIALSFNLYIRIGPNPSQTSTGHEYRIPTNRR